MRIELAGKVVSVTGASSGIGKAIALLLAKQGANVVLGARREDQLKEVVEEITVAGGKAIYVVVDVTVRKDLLNLVKQACNYFGRLDVLVNNAGLATLSRVDAVDVEGWEAMIDVNLKGVLYGMAAAIPVFKQQQAGHIVNIISTAGIKISPTMGVYAATKNAVRTLTEAFRTESDGKIRITGISPGFVKTELAHGIQDEKTRERIQSYMDSMALSPESVADTVAFVISQPIDVEIGDIVIRPAVQD